MAENYDFFTLYKKVFNNNPNFWGYVIAVPAKWVRTRRQNVLNLYTGNAAYIDLFTEYG